MKTSLALALALLLFAALLPSFPPGRAMLIAFDTGAALFLALIAILMLRATPVTMRHRALMQAAGVQGPPEFTIVEVVKAPDEF